MADNLTEGEPGVPGKWVVIGIFLFGMTATGILWIYSVMDRAPFVPMRRALAAAFSEECKPRVEGGRHRNGPLTLRVVLQVDFDPTIEEPDTVKRVAEMEQTIIRLARQHQNLEDYEILEMFLVQLVPEGEALRHETVLTVSEIPPEEVPAKSPSDTDATATAETSR